MTLSEILEKLGQSPNKGPLLEMVVEDILVDSKFANVKRQKGGSQYGFDVIGYLNDECWKIECKNLQRAVSIADIAPKVIWHTSHSTPDRFVIVSPNGFSNDVGKLLESGTFSYPIEIWHSDYLVERISQSPRALARLNISEVEASELKNIPTIFSPSGVRFKAIYNQGEPFSIDYFIRDNELVKSYTEVGFEILVSLNNPTTEINIVHQINARTLQYEKINGRILRQFRQKGLIEPLVLPLRLKPYPMGLNSLLAQNKIIELPPGSTEYIRFTLDHKKLIPGFYEFIFEATVSDGVKSRTLNSSIFRLNVTSKEEDIARLCVPGKYYDEPVPTILDLQPEDWQGIKDIPDESILYLGYSIFDLPDNQPTDTWKIKQVWGKRHKKTELTLSPQIPQTIVDLKIPIEERILTKNDILENYNKSRL